MLPHCQICGRAIALRQTGNISHHHVRGYACEGIGYPPLEQSDSRLAELAAQARYEAEDGTEKLAALYQRRANWIDPKLVLHTSTARLRADKLARRLRRHRQWPVRFARQMATQGWGDPPPAYLLST